MPQLLQRVLNLFSDMLLCFAASFCGIWKLSVHKVTCLRESIEPRLADFSIHRYARGRSAFQAQRRHESRVAYRKRWGPI